jgi:arabinofuranan 3-O-arabinosyltransferase
MERADTQKLLSVCAGAVAFGYGAWLVMQLVSHRWVVDAGGHAIVTDFLAPYTAGRLALAGHAVAAYSDSAQHAAETAIAGQNFAGRLGWPYPPQYFLILAPLACLTYLQAFLAWILVTVSGYAATIGVIACRRAALFALAAPWCLADLIVGQNGFFTAALIGLALLALERRPLVSAALIAVLTYKPQFGLLIPIALAADGHWRAMAAAAAMVLLAVLVSGAVFGFATFGAFLNVLPSTTRNLLELGAVGWGKLQSVYGFFRWIGMTDGAAWIAQAIFAAALVAGMAVLWRSKTSFCVKAAGLAAATVLVTPYVFLYDLPVMTVSMAFLSRERALDRLEMGAVVATVGAFVAAALLAAPLAWIGGVVLVAICARRGIGPGLLVRRGGCRSAFRSR